MRLSFLRSHRGGAGLMVMVILIALTGTYAYSSSVAFQSQAKQTQLRIDQVKAHYLAQAGVHKVVWDWYTSNALETARRWSPVNVTVTGNQIFKAGMDASGGRLHSNYAYHTSVTAPSIEFVQNVATAAHHASGTTSLTATLGGGINVPAGDLLVVAMAQDGGAVSTSLACDDSKNVPADYIRVANVVPAANSNAVTRVTVFYSFLPVALAPGDTITVSWTNNIVAKSMTAFHFQNVDAYDAVAAGATGASTAPNSGNVTTTAINDLLVGAIAVEGPTGDAFTPTVVSPVWNRNPPTRVSTSHSTNASNATINAMYRIVSATGNYAASATITNRDWAATNIAFKEHARWFDDGTGNQRLRRWQIYNLNNGNSLTLDKIKVSWTGGGAARLNGFVLNGTSYWPGGTAASGSTVDFITDPTLANGGSWSGANTYLQWDNNGPADPVTVTCQFIWSGDDATTDARSSEVILWDGAKSAEGGLPTKRLFCVTSTGQVNQSSFKVLKTIKATIGAKFGTSFGTGEIFDWDAGDKNIP